jgi:hypothetical protein
LSDIKLIPDTDVAPMQPLTPQILSDAFATNVDALRELAFGMQPPLLVLAHDHGANRGEVLERPVVTWTLGPTSDNLVVGNWLPGVPVYPPSSGSFATTPKLLASCGMLLGGNVGDVTVRIVGQFSGAAAASMTVRVEMRVFGDAGLDPAEGTGIYTDITISKPALGTAIREGTGTLLETDIRGLLGLTGLDRECELAVWLVADPTQTCRLLSVMLTGAMCTTFDASPTGTQITTQIEPLDIQQGRKIIDVLGTKLKRRLNQATFNVLGKIPGMANLTLEDTTRWARNLTTTHQHKGMSEGDGACIRQGMWSQPYCVDLGVVGAATMNTSAVLGLRAQTGGTAFGQMTIFEGRVSMPIGLGAINLRLAMVPDNNSLSTRLIVRVIVDDDMTDGTPPTSYATSISTATYAQDNALTAGNFIGCQVNPIDTAAYNSVGSGDRALWTLRDLLASQPSGRAVGAAYRITELITIGVDLPATSDYRVKLACGIETPVGSNTFDSNALIQWAYMVPAYGY